MNLQEYTRQHNITIEAIVAQVDVAIRLAAEDVLFAAGSLVEGLGNAKSDLDLFLLTCRQDIQFTSLNDVTVIVGKCVVDIRVVQLSVVDSLLQRFDQWAKMPRQPRRAFEFTEDERKLLHRIRCGQVLHGAEPFGRLRSRLDFRELARHKLDWSRHLANTLQIDLAGFRSAGDACSMMFVAQELLALTIDGLLAAHGDTNPNWKWRCRLLGRLPSDLELRLPGRPTGLSPTERFLSLHQPPRRVVLHEVVNYSLRIVAFSRTILPWAEFMLLAPEHEVVPAVPLTQPDDVGGPYLPHLDLDVAVEFREGSFEVRRLNEPGQRFLLSPRAYSLFCLFDGETPRAYALRYAERLTTEKSGGTSVEEIATLVRHAQLEVDASVDEEMLASILTGSKPRIGGAP